MQDTTTETPLDELCRRHRKLQSLTNPDDRRYQTKRVEKLKEVVGSEHSLTPREVDHLLRANDLFARGKKAAG